MDVLPVPADNIRQQLYSESARDSVGRIRHMAGNMVDFREMV
jgi:hypothetical protein